jgi:hypothetical protein
MERDMTTVKIDTSDQAIREIADEVSAVIHGPGVIASPLTFQKVREIVLIAASLLKRYGPVDEQQG